MKANTVWKQRKRQRGSMTAEVAVSLGILVTVALPLVMSFVKDQKEGRDQYLRAVAMEIVDGEMEVLAAGAWRQYAPGRHEYPIAAAAAGNLPEGDFIFTRDETTIRLEWRPRNRPRRMNVKREMRLP